MMCFKNKTKEFVVVVTRVFFGLRRGMVEENGFRNSDEIVIYILNPS